MNRNSLYTFLNDKNNILETDVSFNKNNGSNGFISTCDTRVKSNITGEITPLDRPPFTLYNNFDNIYNEKYDKVGKPYNTYSDIDAGNIIYYISEDVKGPFPEVAYDLNGVVRSNYEYNDPMTNRRIQHNFTPENKVSCSYQRNKNYYGNLSFINDTSIQREEIMALQSRKQNEQKWSSSFE